MADDNNNCVNGSVDGVNIAPIMVEISMTYRHEVNICFADIIFSKPNTI